MSCRTRFVSVLFFLTISAMFAPRTTFGQAVQVVDMIPNALSDETNRDSEPFISVNPANPAIIAATAFMPTPAMMANGPLLTSFDGGNTWVTRGIIPSNAGGLNTFDVTIRFNTSGTALYAGMLRDPTVNLEIVRTSDMNLNTPMTLLNTPRATDQPYIFARTVTGWFDSGKDRLWVGNNESAANPKSATVDQTLDAAAGAPVFTQNRIDTDAPVGRDNYQVRTTANADGHVYAAFYRRKGAITGGYNADVVVVRDDNWGKTGTPFQSLVQNVVALTPVSDSFGSSSTLGNEWWGGDLYLTVDPNDASRVYISYSDSQASAPRTLHLRRSIDYGQTWDPDILTVASAKNAAIAVNSHGVIGYLYQQLTGATPNWETHLRRSPDAVTWDDVILSSFHGQGAGSPGGTRIIGDYLNMVAVGKNFYGVFSAYNSLVDATFPAGVTFQRNKTAAGSPTPRFLGTDGVTTVSPSIDPFFFRTAEIDPAADFYVRDWTDNATTRDHGQEPSVRDNFYSTSDVWNERTNDPLSFDANDRPQVQDPQPAAVGHNFAFARIGRESAGPIADVALHYYYSDGGVGVNFVDAGSSVPLHFNAGDLQQSPAVGAGHQWDLPSGASNHVCLAVEISTASDPILAPSLLNHAPGWPTTDLMVVNDNNKAQRNLQVFGYGGMSNEVQAAMYALVHNGATFTRNMTVGIRFPPPRDLGRATLRVLGDGRSDGRTVRRSTVLTLDRMTPGENRWIELSFSPGLGTTASAPVSIIELVNGVAVNGYALGPTRMPVEDAIRETLFQHAAVFTRLAETFGLEEAKEQSRSLGTLIEAKETSPEKYGKFLQAQAKSVAKLTGAFVKKTGPVDVFGVNEAAKFLARVIDPKTAQPMHLTLLNKIDAALTMRQKSEGDVADIPQNVRWQRDLFLRLKGLRGAKEIVRQSTDFLEAFEQHKIGIEGFQPLVASLMEEYREAAASDKSGRLARLLDAVGAAKSPTALQKAHRTFLLALGGN